MIPENMKNAVKVAFGVTSYDDIKAITIGLSNALTYRIVIKNKPYLMRIAPTDSNPTNYFANMQAGAEIGLAPRVWYLGTQDKISITDFIEAKPFPISKANDAETPL